VRRLSTVYLLIKVACFVKLVNNIFNIKRSWSKLISTRRSTVLNLSPSVRLPCLRHWSLLPNRLWSWTEFRQSFPGSIPPPDFFEWKGKSWNEKVFETSASRLPSLHRHWLEPQTVRPVEENKELFNFGAITSGLYYKCFMIVIYYCNDSGQYYKTTIMIVIYDLS